MIENEIKALRVAIETAAERYIGATEMFAAAVNHMNELLETRGAQAAVTGTDVLLEDKPEPKEEKPKATKKKVTKKKAAKKVEEPAEKLTVQAVRKLLVAAVSDGHGAEVQKLTKSVMDGMSLADLDDGDVKLTQLRDGLAEITG
jgi:hypothetical protein